MQKFQGILSFIWIYEFLKSSPAYYTLPVRPILQGIDFETYIRAFSHHADLHPLLGMGNYIFTVVGIAYRNNIRDAIRMASNPSDNLSTQDFFNFTLL